MPMVPFLLNNLLHVPNDKMFDKFFFDRGVWSGLVSRGHDTFGLIFGNLVILFIHPFRKRNQLFDAVISTLFRRFVN